MRQAAASDRRCSQLVRQRHDSRSAIEHLAPVQAAVAVGVEVEQRIEVARGDAPLHAHGAVRSGKVEVGGTRRVRGSGLGHNRPSQHAASARAAGTQSSRAPGQHHVDASVAQSGVVEPALRLAQRRRVAGRARAGQQQGVVCLALAAPVASRVLQRLPRAAAVEREASGLARMQERAPRRVEGEAHVELTLELVRRRTRERRAGDGNWRSACQRRSSTASAAGAAASARCASAA